MSDITPSQDPAAPGDGTEPTTTIETLETAPARGRTARRAVLVVAAALVVALLGGGAWAAYQFFYGGGPRPDEVLPTSTVAVVSVDLDPSGGQKIAAIKSIRKFPALKETLGLKADDDLRKFIFDKATGSGECSSLDFEDDVEPWIGKRAAFGAVDLGDEYPAPVLAIQISDQDKAKAGFDAIADCGDLGDDFAYVVGEDYVIASDSEAHAKEILRTGKSDPLSDDAQYQRWTDEAGDQGVLNFYVSPKVTQYVDDLLESFGSEVFGSGDYSEEDFGEDFEELPELEGSLLGSSVPPAADDAVDDAIDDALKDFQGLAGTLRFADGGMELSFASGGLKSLDQMGQVGKQIGSLPADTALALGFGIPEGSADEFMTGFSAGAGVDSEEMVDQVEQEFGVRLPEDLETLLGTALTLSVGGDAPERLADLEDFSDVPLALVIHGDAAKIKDVISSIEEHTGYYLEDIPVEVAGDDDKVVLSPSSDYAEDVLEAGSLGKDKRFLEAVPNADRATGVFYLNIASPWRDTLLDFAQDDGASSGDVRDAEENTAPLRSVGFSSWVEDKVQHVLLKVTTK